MSAIVSKKPQLGRRRLPSGATSPASGATMPNPSVALWRANPMTSRVASATSSRAADCPIASPSAKLCRPMPTAMSSANRRAGDHAATPDTRSVADIAPGPTRRVDALVK